jgi:hypothetical protein
MRVYTIIIAYTQTFDCTQKHLGASSRDKLAIAILRDIEHFIQRHHV